MLLRGLWFFLSGFSSALALVAGARHDWTLFAFFFAWAVGALVAVLRGYFGTGEEGLCRHGNRLDDGRASYNRARLALVKTEVGNGE